MIEMGPRTLRAWVTHEPWTDYYEVRMGGGAQKAFFAATVEMGRIVYKEEEGPSGQVVEPFMRLSEGEVEALSKALLADHRPEDVTFDALKDARSTRDRLLSMFEARGIR